MVAYDAAGGVLCAGVDNNTIKLYDVRNLDKGPFVNFNMKRKLTSQWSNVKFSPCGTYILASALDGAIFLLDAFNGNVVRQYAGHLNQKLTPMETGFSPDAKFVLAGSEDGSVYIWDTKDHRAKPEILSGHGGPVTAVKWNPKKMLLASACSTLALWVPQN